jgi:integrase
LQHCSQVFRYAIATGRAEHDITANLKGALQPAISNGLAHLPESVLPEFLSNLEQYDTEFGGNILTKLAFKLLILTFVRSGEIRGAKWGEIDWDKAQWRIPAERMKMRDLHIVPLAKQSIAILKELKNITGHSYSGYVFPSQKNPRNMMSENTFLRAIMVMGYKGKTTGHGFRSTASTILNENGFKPDVIERQLAHCERDQVRNAYNHAEYLPERAEMMQWYANYLESVQKNAGKNVVKLAEAKR